MTTDTLSSYIRSDFVDRSRESEQLLIEICREGRTELLISERAFLARECGWDERECKKQLVRVRNILRLQAICGRPEDREAALQECQTSVDLLAKQGPKIEEKIEKLRVELAGLERDASTAQKRVEAHGDAVLQLRKHCPQDIVERVRQAVQVVEAGIGQTRRDAEARRSELRSILNIDNCHGDQTKHLEWGLQRLLPEAVEKILYGPATGNQTMHRQYSAQWPALKAECEREYSELCGRLPELQAEYDEAIRQAELPLDFYSDPAKQND